MQGYIKVGMPFLWRSTTFATHSSASPYWENAISLFRLRQGIQPERKQKAAWAYTYMTAKGISRATFVEKDLSESMDWSCTRWSTQKRKGTSALNAATKLTWRGTSNDTLRLVSKAYEITNATFVQNHFASFHPLQLILRESTLERGFTDAQFVPRTSPQKMHFEVTQEVTSQRVHVAAQSVTRHLKIQIPSGSINRCTWIKRNFQCDLCPKAFNWKCDLKVHK